MRMTPPNVTMFDPEEKVANVIAHFWIDIVVIVIIIRQWTLVVCY